MKVICRGPVQTKSINDQPLESALIELGREYVALAIRIEPEYGPYILIEYLPDHLAWAELTRFECTEGRLSGDWHFFDRNNEAWYAPESWAYDTFFDELAQKKPQALALFKAEASKTYAAEEVY